MKSTVRAAAEYPVVDDGLMQKKIELNNILPPKIEDVDFDTFQRTVQLQQEQGMPPPPRPILKRIPESTDDFLRNFFLRNGMYRTMEAFEIEWYEKYGSKPLSDAPVFADNYLETAALQDRIDILEHQLRQHAELTAKTTKLFLQAKKERDYHRANHNRVVQEKNRVSKLLRQAQNHAEDVNPTLNELRQKCETLHKGKVLLSIERDKLDAKVSRLEKQLENMELRLKSDEEQGGEGRSKSTEAVSKLKEGPSAKATDAKSHARKPGSQAARGTDSVSDGFRWPADERPGPNRADNTCSVLSDPFTWVCQSMFKAHSMPVTQVSMHPEKPAVASSSDDGTWRLSTLPQGEVVMSGDGHKSWISSVAMHPTGTMVATASGDKTVKLWDFATNSCRLTLKGHCDSVWCLDFQETGLLLASGALDQTARIWDATTGKCRQTLRGHVDTVNAVVWKPFTNTLCTGSGDKTVSLWDCRMNCCAQTLYGHRNIVRSVAVVGPTEALASCDADGVVVLWDIRRMEQQLTVACGPYAANHVASDVTGTYLVVASDDTTMKIIDISNSSVGELAGHEDGVQCAMFDPSTNNFIVSGCSDGTIGYWC
ncbi:pf20-like protein [Trypanosoma rangeli]|uniref:Pf20-like protein n=1 Tax=Trypanosoma rangeli TaxID=5698 RepID=A0A3R7NP23_TRYRA|nr:pf20-like protein [Trypanosoma rangeli]RNF05494.1 pf20-like protein [Trypanosoma rangeli]|eukprot:RNF05494.1 pf20-like protein [Trypanosoma rangeli]